MGWRVITLAFALLVSSSYVRAGVLPQPGIQSQHHQHGHDHGQGQGADGNAAESRSLGAAGASENTDEEFDPNADRSYNFEFAGDEYSRRETADPTGNVVGTYTFVDASGASKTVNYKAGAETGFVIEDGQQQTPLAAMPNMLQAQQVPAAGYASPVMMMVAMPNAAGGYSYAAPSNALPVSLAMPMPMPPARLYETPAAPVIATNLYASPAAEPIAPPPPPPAPARLYETPAAPVVATNLYASPAAEPIAPPPPPPARLYETPSAPVIATNLYASPAAEPIAKEKPLPMYEEPAIENYKKAAPQEEAKITFKQATINQDDWTPNSDHAFEFKSTDGNRKEEALPGGGVQGSYTMLDASGQMIEVKYKATAETGFVIENMDEVLQKSVPAGDPAAMMIMKAQAEAMAKAHAEAQAAQASGVEQAYAAPQDQQHDQALAEYTKQQEEHAQQMAAYMQQVQQYAQQNGQQQNAQQYAQQQPSQAQPQAQAQPQEQEQNPKDDLAGTGDSSYSFQYADASAGSRQEHSDASGNVRGQYSYTNEEGNTIAVQYSAGPNTGFVIENGQQLDDSVKKATVDGAKAAAAFKTSEDKAKGEAALKSSNEQQAASSASGRQPQGHAPAQATRNEAAAEAATDSEAAASAPTTRRMVVVKKRKQISNPEDSNAAAADATAEAPAGAGDHSFSFSYAAKDGSAREESSDAAGERMGSYRYTDEKGETVEVKYRAGRNGFQVINA